MKSSGETEHSKMGDGMGREINAGSWVLALLIGLIGVGCTAGNDAPEPDQDAAATEVPAEESAPRAPSPAATPKMITATELVDRLEGPNAPVILDVRSPEEFEKGHIPGAINLPYDQIGDRIGSLEPYRQGEVVVYCRTGRRAGIAESALSGAGFENVRDLEGHMVSWQQAEFPVDVPAACC